MKVTFLGHAAVLIEDKKNIIIDPFITGNPVASLKLEDLPKIDYILVTHGHGDHLGDTVEIAKKNDATVISNYEICQYLSKKGLKTHAMHIGGSYLFDFGRVKMTPAVHGSSIIEGEKIIYGGNPGGFLVTIDDKKIYHAGDTGLTKEMELLTNENIDLAFLPIGGNFVMDVEDAVLAASMIKPKKVIPMHYGTWEIIFADVELFRKKVEDEGIECVILEPGDSLEL
ncbi:metal-dependent hydrolase [Thermotoga sp. KOL6]|uniref:metal-dependent hydrolase n=1 Tax=Thermotoga sp. KOL6 TaxID=126741 RepID=UPI000C793EB3|nr:metal-dependent hydrolase [Thermotoga sp. KOL6]PLV59886.1 metal-dependent hydrolase [Thermotoga sp. KOL6]